MPDSDFTESVDDENEYEAWFRRKVEAGQRDVRAGRVFSNEEVEAHFASLRAATRRTKR